MVKLFLRRLLLFLLIPLPLLYGLQYVIDTGLRRSHHVYYEEWNELFRSRINADVLICGSSRAVKDISPAVLDTVLHVNSYNIGMDGTHPPLQFERLQLYLQHNKVPDVLVQVVDLTSFTENSGMDNSLQFLPYLDDTSVWRLTAKYTDHFTFADRYVPMIKYSNQLPLMAEGIRSFFGRGTAPLHVKGYFGRDARWDGSFERYVARLQHPISIRMANRPLQALQAQLRYCKERNIKVVLVFPPVYHTFLDHCTNYQYILQTVAQCAAKEGAVFLDYSQHPMAWSKDNFYNSQHLNRSGAEVFSHVLARDILLTN